MKTYIVIDLKSFYASVECVERGLDPLKTKLVVADPERSEKTICLAITPAMKALGIKNRCRVFQIPKGIDYIMATPRMQLYIDYSAKIYGIYLKYVSKDDIHVYSIDEAFLDITDYLLMYGTDAKELSMRIMRDIYDNTGITATCGIGTNLYLAKIALDITAKHVPDHIGILDEEAYRNTLWNHRPITDFWRVGPGIAASLAKYGMYTMGDVAHCDENLLYRIFGIDAELLLDHAWGRETTTMEDIKNYKPDSNSMSSGQILPRGYRFEEAELIVKEMVDNMCLDLVDKGLVTSSMSLYIGYEAASERFGANGTAGTDFLTCSPNVLIPCVQKLYAKIVNRDELVRRISISFNEVVDEAYMQYNIFSDPITLERERNVAKAMLSIKKKYGKNAILKGMNLDASSTARERNEQIGGHKK